MKKFKFLTIILVLLALLYAVYSDSLPPRTPVKVARLVSGFDIPRDSRVIYFEEEDNVYGGDHHMQMSLKIKESDFDFIKNEAIVANYSRTPIVDLEWSCFFNADSIKGYYKVTKNSAQFKVIAIDTIKQGIHIDDMSL